MSCAGVVPGGAAPVFCAYESVGHVRKGWKHKSHSLHPPEVRQRLLKSAVFVDHFSAAGKNFPVNIFFCVNVSKCKCC